MAESTTFGAQPCQCHGCTLVRAADASLFRLADLATGAPQTGGSVPTSPRRGPATQETP